MARIKRVEDQTTDGTYGYSFKCPGCKATHVVPITGNMQWTFNGDVNKPSFQPSLLVTSGHYCKYWKPSDGCPCTWALEEGWEHEEGDFSCFVCHSYVTDGCIEFLSDCSHEYVGQTVPLAEIAEIGTDNDDT